MQVDQESQSTDQAPIKEPVQKKKKAETNQPSALPEVRREDDPRLANLREIPVPKPSERKASALARERGTRPRGGGSSSSKK
jgi:hypothetical protein